MAKPELSADEVRYWLDYDPATGIFRWRVQKSRKMPAGKIAGTPHNYGYLCICLNGHKYLAHRLAWLIVHGIWPSKMIDHIDGDPSNNRLSNLREATHAQNCQNSRGSRSGLKGTYRHSRGGFIAQIKKDGKVTYLGCFKTEEEGHAAYQEAARRIFGEFARMS